MRDSYHVIGLMSGTSLDGLDIAYCSFDKLVGGWEYQIVLTESITYNEEWKIRLKNAIHLKASELLSLHEAYGAWLGQVASDFIHSNSLTVDFIASHGHTVFHQPKKGFSLQIGNAQRLALDCGTPVIADFRSKDIALGGQGAPMVPIGDELLFGKYAACLNLGGIANISLKVKGTRIAFDIGLANMLLNHLANETGIAFDQDGKLARQGVVDENLLNELNQLAYYSLPYPKSVGAEWFLSDVLPVMGQSSSSVEDKLATAVEHEAVQIGKVINHLVTAKGKILVTGGGAFNSFLMERISQQLSGSASIYLPDRQLIEFKEAMVFAFIGVLRWREEINCLSTVTGATTDSSCGIIYLPG